MIAYIIVGTLFVALVGLSLSIRILKQYERAVAFHLGKIRETARATAKFPSLTSHPEEPCHASQSL